MTRVKLSSRHSKAGNKLYAEYRMNGKRIRKSLGLIDTKANVAYAHRNLIPEIEKMIERGYEDRKYMLSEFTQIVLEEAGNTLTRSTYKTYSKGVKAFFRIFGDKEIGIISVLDIDSFIKGMIREGYSSSAVSTYLAPISKAFVEAIRVGIIDKNPVQYAKRPKIVNKKKNPFNLMQMKRILDEAEGSLKMFLYFAFFTGARPNEILALQGQDISDKTITIERTFNSDGGLNPPKGGKTRRIPILNPLKEFFEEEDIQLKRKRFVIDASYSVVSRNFKKLLKSLGYEYTTLHNTRHTFTSLLLQAKESPTLAQHFLGHSDLTMINKVYAHYIEDERDVSRLSEILAV